MQFGEEMCRTSHGRIQGKSDKNSLRMTTIYDKKKYRTMKSRLSRNFSKIIGSSAAMKSRGRKGRGKMKISGDYRVYWVS